MAIPARQSAPYKDAGRFFVKMLCYPPVIAYFVLGFTLPYWIWHAVYALLLLHLVDSTGAALWLATGLGVSCLAVGIVFMFVYVARVSKMVRAARRCNREGDQEGYERNRAEVAAARKLSKMWPIWMVMLSIYIIIPSSVATAFSDGTPVIIKDHGRLRFGDRSERLRSTLHWIKQREF